MASPPHQTTAPSDTSEPPAPPPLTYELLTSSTDQRDALHLVADSIAQQRQVASFAILSHPLFLVSLVIACAWTWRRNARDLGTALTAAAGLAIVFLAAVRFATARYVTLAEQFRWRDFLKGAGGEDDLVLAARFGEEIIGVLVLHLRGTAAEGITTPSKESSLKGGNGSIRAWTTKMRYREKGVGADLLRFAIVTTRRACGSGAQVSFAPDHANSALLTFNLLNRPFRSRDGKAKKALGHALQDCDHGQSSFQ